jgi:hypothetical protein
VSGRCERLVEVPYPLPGYGAMIFKPCGAQADTVTTVGKFVCAEHASS